MGTSMKSELEGRRNYNIQQYESGRGDYTRDRRSWLHVSHECANAARTFRGEALPPLCCKK
jgi:hypothetical protein